MPVDLNIDFTDIVFLLALSIMVYFVANMKKEATEYTIKSQEANNRYTDAMLKSMQAMIDTLNQNRKSVDILDQRQIEQIDTIDKMVDELKNVCDISQKLKYTVDELKKPNKKRVNEEIRKYKESKQEGLIEEEGPGKSEEENKEEGPGKSEEENKEEGPVVESKESYKK